ncbi:S-adenosyl-L-methionine-dependent methyltransferase [Serendipita vermifera]|nr:S-adenosyl-L-methionine-dependent methyltransferase [Serendipita vermifera]
MPNGQHRPHVPCLFFHPSHCDISNMATEKIHSYVLPHHDREYARLDNQHEASKLTWEGLYPQPCHDMVRKALSPSSNETKRVLDLGSGSGAWCIDMALEFPHAEVLGIDIQIRSKEHAPSNCKFQVLDINAGLSQFHGMYDLVHCRYTGQGFADHRKSMIDAVKCLKPGGVIIFIDITEMIREDFESAYTPATSSNLDGSWHQRMYFIIQYGGEALGNDQRRALDDVEMGFWDIEGCDPTHCGGIEMMVPMGHWVAYTDTEEATWLKAVTEAWTNIVGKVHYHLEKPLKAAGRSDKDIQLLFKKIDEDFLHTKHRMRTHCRVVWGQTLQTTGTAEALETSQPSTTRPITRIPDGEFEFLRVYYDKKEWRERNERLRATRTPDMIGFATVESYDMIENL